MRGFHVHRFHRCLALCIVFALLVGLVNGHGYLTFAYEAQPGMIRPADGAMVETKAEPSDTAAKQNGLNYGKPVTVVDEVTDENGVLWYKIEYNLKAGGTSWGYCHAEDVLLDKNIKVFAYGVINTTEVSIRDDAGTDRTNILIQVDTGTKVEMLDQTLVNGSTWYRIRYTAPDTVDAATGEKIPGVVYIGWSYGSYVTMERYNVEIDPEYVEELKTKGFPESYAMKLAELHAIYPEWVFNPVMTGLTWDEVIQGETVKPDGSSNPINMIPNSYDDSMKSTHPDDYSWEENRWSIYDGDIWVAVNPAYLAYIMDPRNWFTEEAIFQFESLSFSESHNLEGVQAVIGTSFMSKDAVDSDGSMFNYANAFMAIGKEVGVSPYHLVSRVRQEQGASGTSQLISGTYKGYEGIYNYFNFGASGISSTAVIENGLKYAKSQGWTTRYAALKGGAERIAKTYIAKGQDTLYFQKFNVVWKEWLYAHQYMGAVLAPSSEAKSIAKAYSDKHQAFVFRIPVYENMPEEAVTFTPTGNPNNYLSDITVEGLSLSPSFTGANTQYTITVDYAISSINVSATPVVSKAKVEGTGAYTLAVGTNTIKLLCTSESGSERIYTLTVVRESENGEIIGPGTEDSGTEDTGTEDTGTDNPSDEPTESDPTTGTENPSQPDNPSDEPTESDPTTGTETPSEPESPSDEPTESAPTYTYVDLNQTMYATGDVFIRDIPLKDGNQLGMLSKNQAIVVTGQCNETGWYRINYGSGVGYVSNNYLTLEAPIPPSISSSTYKIGTYITGIQPGTTAEDFLKGFELLGGAEVKLLDKNGANKTGTVGTGNVLAVYGSGQLVASYELVIYGDASGDGVVSILDIMKINRHSLGISALSGCYLEAADVNKKDGVTILDIMIVNRHTLGIMTIEQ